MKRIIGIILLAGGVYFGIQGYNLRQTSTAQIEREASEVIKSLSNNKLNLEQEKNNEANLMLFGGAIAAGLGIVLILAGKKK